MVRNRAKVLLPVSCTNLRYHRTMKLLLTGATGFAGGETLKQALRDDSIAEVIVPTRRSLGVVHPKLTGIILENFLDYRSVPLINVDACIWCLGVSQTAVNEKDYVVITHDYAVAAAKALFAANSRARFCFVSGRSADPAENRSSQLYSRIKGRTEQSLSALSSERVFVFRPGYIN